LRPIGPTPPIPLWSPGRQPQNDNGINISPQDGANLFDGTNSRWRLGIAPCLEVLIDLPNYTDAFRGTGPSGFGDVTPALMTNFFMPGDPLNNFCSSNTTICSPGAPAI
jgi:hypothetical protein